MPALEVPTLVGRVVRLEPLHVAHVDQLVVASSENRASYGFTVVSAETTSMTAQVEGLLRDFDAGLVVPFAQIEVATNRMVGMTRYLTIRTRPDTPTPYAVEIGGTWLAASAQRTGINTEAKFLLLRHAFEVWRVARVDLKTDNRNERSKAAIARIGASFEGVLRQWQPSQVAGEENLYRDSAMFSIIDSEWPQLRSKFTTLMGLSDQ